MRVSVVIPTFQRGDVVPNAVRSALDQTHGDIEVVVADDGSTDGTAEALEREFGQAVLVVQGPNRGVAAARNAAIAAGGGELVAFLDSDNLWEPEHLETVVGALTRFPAAVLATSGHERRLAGTDGPADARSVDELPCLVRRNSVGPISCCVCPRRELEAVGGFDERLRVAEDSDLFARLAVRGPFAVLNRATLVRPGGRTDSLWQRGRESGELVDALELSAAGLAGTIESSPRPDRHALARECRGWSSFFAAIRALARDDRDGTRGALERACDDYAELSTEAGAVTAQLRRVVPGFGRDPAVRLTWLERLASLWPDAGSQTARVLRIQALDAAAELGGMPGALRSLGRASHGQTLAAARHAARLALRGRPR